MVVRDKKIRKVVLGIDPGSTTIGYGILSYRNGDKDIKVKSYGYIDLKPIKGDSERLVQLNKDIEELVKKFKPDHLAIESLFYFKNLKTFTPVMQSRGVIICTAASLGTDVSEYTPLQVKQIISGHGRGSKQLIHDLVRSVLNIKSNIRPDDVSDALAIALCHIRSAF